MADSIADRPAFSLDYRRAPVHRFPAAHDDALNGYLWLLARGEDIVVMGDSAGGHLALGLCVQLRELGLGQPRAVVAFSALVDSTWTLSREREQHVDDAFVRVRAAQKLTELYTGSDHFDDPRLNVLGAVGPDLPPILLRAGAAEALWSRSPRGNRNRTEQFTTAARDRRDRRSPPRRVRASRPSHAAHR
ncbi:alpha/beta hydrolase fold domain-containing protein [Nocardia pseudovaccinii]|uniref:alpha/beta hydrolase fold domain-containing protein n=1 Tax=Nocardia pseudovaccinii TaxID=189540 RepID=UPI001FDFACBD|nr:alpha/beta hydrolase fold domain-containing protein [Nocardia pseudovaccinii]